MKVTVCDVCYYQDGKLTEAKFILSRKTPVAKVSIHACDSHHNWTKQFKTFEEMRVGVQNLVLTLHKVGV